MDEPEFLRDTRTSYDVVAEGYVARFGTDVLHPLEEGMLLAFARLAGPGPVLDVGCGPGRAAGYLAGCGLDVSGVDLSPAMVAIAKAAHPGLRFDTASMTALPHAEASLDGLVASYSLIHVPAPERPAVLAGFRRVLRPGAPLLLGFQVGHVPNVHTEAFGHPVNLTFWRLDPDEVSALLVAAGFEPRARLIREAEPEEPTSNAWILAR